MDATMEATRNGTPPAAGARSRWWALGALVPAVVAVGVDGTVLSVALPTLAGALRASTDQLQWFVAAYTLVFAAAMLPAGLLGDRFGRKKLLLGALALFGLASLGCSYAGSAGAFIAARAVLGLAAATVLPLSLAVLPVLFSHEERPKAIALWAGASLVAYPIGPILGGWLLTHFRWGSVFLINVPVVVIALIAVGALLPESRSAARPRLDLAGVLASSAGLSGLTYGVIEAGQRGWGDPGALAAMLAGVLVLAGFVLWERRVGQPLVDLALFRSAGFTAGTLLASMVSFAMVGVLFAMPQYFQAVGGVDAMGSGLRLLPLIGGMVVGLAAGNRLAPRTDAKVTVALGFALLAGGLAAGATTNVRSGDGFAAAWTAVCGLGLGVGLPAAMDAALGALSAERSGVGSALIQALRMVAGTIGVALLGTVLNAGYRGRLDLAGLPAPAADAVRQSVATGVAVARQLGSAALLDAVRAAFVHGMDAMLWVSGGAAALGVVVALAFLPGRARGTAAERAKVEEEAIVAG
ncbi:MAG TPA: DHA2 family efflux MFS transporter permease subunit [Vicinamibacteria bacterium]